VLEFDAHVSTAILAVGRAGILPAALTLLGSAPVADFSQPRMNTDGHGCFRIGKKENNEMEPRFLRSCFANLTSPPASYGGVRRPRRISPWEQLR